MNQEQEDVTQRVVAKMCDNSKFDKFTEPEKMVYRAVLTQRMDEAIAESLRRGGTLEWIESFCFDAIEMENACGRVPNLQSLLNYKPNWK